MVTATVLQNSRRVGFMPVLSFLRSLCMLTTVNFQPCFAKMPEKAEKLSYCADMVAAHQPELYWLALFVPEPAREGLLRLYALDVELSHLRRMVSEEMIGHIRYAWWREALEALFQNRPRQGHPVLEALAGMPLPQAEMLALQAAYEEAYPAAPAGAAAARAALSRAYLRKAAPQALPAWEKASAILEAHKAKHGEKARLRLLVKLLLAGLMPRR